MATVTLQPQDLTPAQAARVLALLNSASSAQALAAAGCDVTAARSER